LANGTILYVIGSLDLGGAERHVAALAPQLKKRGWQPVIYCLTARGSQADAIAGSGVPVLGPRWEMAGGQTAVGKFFRLIASSLRLLTVMLKQRPDIAHFFLPAAYIIGAPIAMAARVPVRIMSRRSLNRYQRKHPISRRFEHLLHRHMQMLLGNSMAVVKELREEAADKTPVELVYNGIVASESRSAQDFDPTGLTLIIVANLIPYKGHTDLLHALGAIAGKLPASWELLCVGRDDGLGPTLRKLARELQIDTHITLLGSRTDIPDLLASADIGILCSHEEGFSNAILEGMAAGLPMVVTDVGGNAEAVVDQETGLVVPAHDPATLGAAIAMLASDRKLRKRLGAAARRRVEERFSMEQCVQRYDEIYRSLIRNLAASKK
jgi:glycosyltransferase involved in cell wall biosynthesis